jgi:hypothetical protein
MVMAWRVCSVCAQVKTTGPKRADSKVDYDSDEEIAVRTRRRSRPTTKRASYLFSDGWCVAVLSKGMGQEVT